MRTKYSFAPSLDGDLIPDIHVSVICVDNLVQVCCLQNLTEAGMTANVLSGLWLIIKKAKVTTTSNCQILVSIRAGIFSTDSIISAELISCSI